MYLILKNALIYLLAYSRIGKEREKKEERARGREERAGQGR